MFVLTSFPEPPELELELDSVGLSAGSEVSGFGVFSGAK